ncbi:MAG: RidA family protein [Bradyrhizobiaceae bacterium]|nr:RidA family protein [Bradyrhizobiaceae bacterium]
MAVDVVNSSRAPEPVGAYPHARVVGNLVYLSGVGPRERGTSVIPGVTLGEDGVVIAKDIAAQTLSVFKNVRTILEDAGSAWENIIDVMVFLTDMKNDFSVFNALYAEHFAGIEATRTTIEVGALPTPIAVELKVIATL